MPLTFCSIIKFNFQTIFRIAGVLCVFLLIFSKAVNADVPETEVLFVNNPGPVLNPMGSKGMGEVGIVIMISKVKMERIAGLLYFNNETFCYKLQIN